MILRGESDGVGGTHCAILRYLKYHRRGHQQQGGLPPIDHSRLLVPRKGSCVDIRMGYGMNVARVVIGPLTTKFTPAPACTIALQSDPLADHAWRAQTCTSEYLSESDSAGTFIADGTSCWPPAAGTTTSPPFNGWGFYSPGLICPAGHVTACSATGAGEWGWPVQFSLYSSETAYGCCPSGFTCADQQGKGQTCTRVVTSGQSAVLAGCSAGNPIDIITIIPPITASQTISNSVSVATYAKYTEYAPLIEIRRQATDILPSSTSSSTTDTTTPSGTSQTAQPTTSASGLSTGAKAAIGVVIPAVVLAVLLAAFLVWRRRRARRRADTAALDADHLDDAAATLPAGELSEDSAQRETKTLYAEMSSTPEPQEMLAKLTASPEIQELPGDSRSA